MRSLRRGLERCAGDDPKVRTGGAGRKGPWRGEEARTLGEGRHGGETVWAEAPEREGEESNNSNAPKRRTRALATP